MIHQRKIATEIGGGLLNLDATIDSDIDFEFFDSRVHGGSSPMGRKQKYRSNLTVRQCASDNVPYDIRDELKGEEFLNLKRDRIACKKTKSYTQGFCISDNIDTYSTHTPTPSLASSRHGRSISGSRSALDIINEIPETKTESADDQDLEEDKTSQNQDDENEKAEIPITTSSSPDIRNSRTRLDSESTETLTNSLSCVSLLDNGLRTHVQKRYKNGTRHSMSFSNERFREIERVNQILLKKILSKRKSKPLLQSSPRFSDINWDERQKFLESRKTSAALKRIEAQRQIDIENAKLDKRIRQAKPVTRTR